MNKIKNIVVFSVLFTLSLILSVAIGLAMSGQFYSSKNDTKYNELCLKFDIAKDRFDKFIKLSDTSNNLLLKLQYLDSAKTYHQEMIINHLKISKEIRR